VTFCASSTCLGHSCLTGAAHGNTFFGSFPLPIDGPRNPPSTCVCATTARPTGTIRLLANVVDSPRLNFFSCLPFFSRSLHRCDRGPIYHRIPYFSVDLPVSCIFGLRHHVYCLLSLGRNFSSYSLSPRCVTLKGSIRRCLSIGRILLSMDPLMPTSR